MVPWIKQHLLYNYGDKTLAFDLPGTTTYLYFMNSASNYKVKVCFLISNRASASTTPDYEL